MFDGKFKQKPDQSYGRNDKSMTGKETIRLAAEERRVRELKAKQSESSVIIQSWCRTHIIRKRMREELKIEFDFEIAKSLNSFLEFLNLLKKFLYLYKLEGNFAKYVDNYHRLISLSINMLQMSEHICEIMMRVKKIDDGDEIPISYLVISIKKLLEISCRFISCHASQHSVCLEVPLHVLKEFTSVDSYLRGTSSKIGVDIKVRASGIVSDIMDHICRNGYFTAMKSLLDNNLTTSNICNDGSISRILSDFVDQLLNKKIKHYENAAIELFSSSITHQTKKYFLPKLTDLKFPYMEMLESLPTQKLSSIQIINLFYCILKLGSPHYSIMKLEQFCSLVKIFGHLLEQLSEHDDTGDLIKADDDNDNEIDDNYDDDDDDDDELGHLRMDCDEQEKMEHCKDQKETNEKEEKQLKRFCLDLLGNSDGLSSRLTKLLNLEVAYMASNEKFCISLCKICYNLIGFKNKVSQYYRIFTVLGSCPIFIRRIWEILNVPINIVQEPYSTRITRKLSSKDDLHLFSTFCNSYSYHLATMTDADLSRIEINSRTKPFDNLQEVSNVALTLMNCCLQLTQFNEAEHSAVKLGLKTTSDDYNQFVGNKQYNRIFNEAVALTRQLYERNCRIKFCETEEWVAPLWSLNSLGPTIHRFLDRNFWNNTDNVRGLISANDMSKIIIVKELPFVFNFRERVEFFRDLLYRNKPERTFGLFNTRNIIKIRRDYIYEDAFSNLQETNVPDMRTHIHFSMISTLGYEEAGIDGGGVFREALREIIKAGFNPNLGFFKETSDGFLYPNHLSEEVNKDYLNHYYFLGRILGKAIYARLLVDLPLASFFLVKLLSKEMTRLDIHHMSSLDPELHKNLLFLRDTDDIKSLDLYFNISYDALGSLRTVDLKPNGSNIQVNNNNKFQYIHLVADWHLNRKISKHCMAFRTGLASLVDIDWLRIFDHNELQFVISGADLPIDLDDLKNNTNYSGGYNDDHEVIKNFWSVLEGFTETQKQDFLKFVTCSPRAPLYGFKELRPSFCIHFAGNDTDRLPTSSTCMNLLKLPAFQDKKILNEKLLKAIELGSGFELS